jgi:hypothetical protein
MAAQHGRRSAPAQQAAARLDARGMDIGWVIAWRQLRPAVSKYLAATGFRFRYRADGVSVYCSVWRSPPPGNIVTIPKSALGRQLGYLLPTQEAALTAAIHSAFDLDWALSMIRLL